jgi:CHAT domain-containing protein
MQAMYGYRRDHPDASPAEALQYAQLTLLTGSPQIAASDVQRNAINRDIGSADDDTSGVTAAPAYPSNLPKFSHPYYWAPFVLIGDWK